MTGVQLKLLGIVGAVALVLSLFFLTYREGVKNGTAAANEECRKAQEQARNLRDAVDSQKSAEIESVREPTVKIVESVRTVYRDRPDPECLGADRVQWLKETANANNDSASSGGPSEMRPTEPAN